MSPKAVALLILILSQFPNIRMAKKRKKEEILSFFLPLIVLSRAETPGLAVVGLSSPTPAWGLGLQPELLSRERSVAIEWFCSEGHTLVMSDIS